MRVLHLCWSFSPLTETFIYDPVRGTATGADVAVVTRTRENDLARPFEPIILIREETRVLGKVCDRLLAAVSTDPTPGPFWVSLRRALAAAVRAFRPDLIHAHFGDMGVLAEPVAFRSRIPLLTSFYGYDASLRLRDRRWCRWYRMLTRGRYRTAVLSEDMRGALAGAGLDAERIHVVMTGKRLTEFPFRERSRSPERFVSVGRLVDKKGHLDALEVVSRLVQRGHSVKLNIIGDGPQRGALEARIAALGLGRHVSLTGALDQDATRAVMAASDAMLLCSRIGSDGDREGMPTVLLEAQALGLPCVSTRHAGIPEAVPPEHRWLLSPEGDVEAIASVVQRLLRAGSEEIARISRTGRRHVEDRHDLERQVEVLLGLYREMVN